MLILHNPQTKETLVQTAQVWPDGKTSQQARIPGAKRRPDENQFLCARRILKRRRSTDIHTYVGIGIRMYMYMYAHICIDIYIYMSIVYTYVHVYMYACCGG